MTAVRALRRRSLRGAAAPTGFRLGGTPRQRAVARTVAPGKNPEVALAETRMRKTLARSVRSNVRIKAAMTAPAVLESRVREVLANQRISVLAEEFEKLSAQSDAIDKGETVKPIAYDRRSSLAYLAFRFLPAFGVVKAALLRAVESGFSLPKSKQVTTVLDFGAGPGTASWAAFDVFGFGNDKSRRMESSLVEASLPMIDAATRLSRGVFSLNWCRNVLELVRGSRIDSLDRYDIVFATYALSELPSAATRRLVVDVLWRSVAPNGLLLVLERGSPHGAGIIGDVRDQVLRNGTSEFDLESLTDGRSYNRRQNKESSQEAPCTFRAKIVAPCGHEKACPLRNAEGLSGKNKFCHFAQHTERLLKPSSAKESSTHRSSFSYIAVRKDPATDSMAETDPEELPLRVLRKPRKNIRHIVLDLCLPDHGVEQLIVPHSNRLQYKIARHIQWGDSYTRRLQIKPGAEQVPGSDWGTTTTQKKAEVRNKNPTTSA